MPDLIEFHTFPFPHKRWRRMAELYLDGNGPKGISVIMKEESPAAIQRILSRLREMGLTLPYIKRGSSPSTYEIPSVSVSGMVGKCPTKVWSTDRATAKRFLGQLSEAAQ
jgi:hypothetical protein